MNKISFYDQIAKNNRNSVLLSIFVVALVALLVYIIAYILVPGLAIFILIFAAVIMIVDAYASYNYGDRLVLKATNAKPADPVEHVYLINTVEGLSIAAGIPPPKVYIVEDDEINAFAVGKDPKHASIAVTTGALKNLNRTELEGVVGHELTHVADYDVRFMTLVAVLVGLVAILSWMLIRGYLFSGRQEREGRGLGILILIGFLLAILAPLFSRIVQAMVSRRRELSADAGSAKLTRYPEGLASALEKIQKVNEGKKMKVSESISHLFISDPNKSPLDDIFATHPPLQQRIKLLRSM
jgi:heat shock protein HtpX